MLLNIYTLYSNDMILNVNARYDKQIWIDWHLNVMWKHFENFLIPNTVELRPITDLERILSFFHGCFYSGALKMEPNLFRYEEAHKWQLSRIPDIPIHREIPSPLPRTFWNAFRPHTYHHQWSSYVRYPSCVFLPSYNICIYFR